MLWLYDRERKEFRHQPPNKTAVEKDYYTVLNKDGEKDFGIEEFLSQIESRAKPVIAKLEARENITPDERFNLACFVSLLMCRTPKFEREIEEISDATHKLVAKEMIPTVEAAAEHLRRHGGDAKITAESFFKFVHEEKFYVKGNRNITIETMLDQTQKVTMEIALMNWWIAHADERSAFITTDSPLGFIVPEEFQRTGEPVLGLASQKVTKLIPLTKRVALLMGHIGAGLDHFNFSRQQVREFNVTVATESERYVIGPDEALVRCTVKRSKVDTNNPGTRMKVENVSHPTDPNRSFLVARRVSADAPDKPLKIIVKDRPEGTTGN